MKQAILFCTVATAVLAHGTALAASAEAVAFGARESVMQVSLSPSGKKVAVIMPSEMRGTVAIVIELGGQQAKKVVLKADGKPDSIRNCSWATDERLICDVYSVVQESGDYYGSSKLILVAADGSSARLLTAKAGFHSEGRLLNGGYVVDYQAGSSNPNAVLMTRSIVPEMQTGSIVAQRRRGLAVEQVDVNSMARKIVEQPNAAAFTYISDGLGHVRVVGMTKANEQGYDGNTDVYMYRKAGETTWLPLSTVVRQASGTSIGFVPDAVDPTLNVVYGYDGNGGRSVVSAISLDGSLKKTVVYDQGAVDVSDLVTIGRQHRVIGVSFATDVRQATIFDPEMKKLSAALAKALPNLPLVQVVDASADESVLLLWAGSDVDPGRYYIYDKKTHGLGELLGVRPQLNGRKLAPVKPVYYAAGDGTSIPAYLTVPVGSNGKNLPLIVMPHGGPASRDEWGFDWLPQFFAARGYAVLQPNFRGSTGYGANFFQKNGYQSWRTAISDVTDAARWAVAQGIARRDAVGIFGWSYGGYAALQSAVTYPDVFKAVVAVAPVTDLEALRKESEHLSSYKLRDQQIGRGEHVDAGSPARHAEKIAGPVLLVHGDRDINVAVAESKLMRDRLKSAGKSVEYLEFQGLDHQLEDDAARTELLDKADMLMRGAMGIN